MQPRRYSLRKLPLDSDRLLSAPVHELHRLSFDANGRKSGAGFHAELLGDEEDDPFAYDFDLFGEFTPKHQDRFLAERDPYLGKQDDFLKELLARQHE